MLKVLKEIPQEKLAKRGWTVEINGNVVPDVRSLTLSNKSFGTIEYGEHSAGYDSFCFAENGGGGSVITPYSIISGQIFVGLVQQGRPYHSDNPVWNLPRGFLDPGKNHFQTGLSEVQEEMGIDVSRKAKNNFATRFFPLAGEPMNPNSTFFVTKGRNDDGSPKGVKFFGLEFINPKMVGNQPIVDGNTNLEEMVISIQEGSVAIVQPDPKKFAEQILKCSFFHWRKAVMLADGFTVAGVARLMAHVYAPK